MSCPLQRKFLPHQVWIAYQHVMIVMRVLYGILLCIYQHDVTKEVYKSVGKEALIRCTNWHPSSLIQTLPYQVYNSYPYTRPHKTHKTVIIICVFTWAEGEDIIWSHKYQYSVACLHRDNTLSEWRKLWIRLAYDTHSFYCWLNHLDSASVSI